MQYALEMDWFGVSRQHIIYHCVGCDSLLLLMASCGEILGGLKLFITQFKVMFQFVSSPSSWTLDISLLTVDLSKLDLNVKEVSLSLLQTMFQIFPAL